jgi:hypothetical protein
MKKETFHQRDTLNSVKKNQISCLQQSMMTSQRKERATRMNLIEEKNENSKIYNYIMTTLKKSNIVRKFESYRFKRTIDFSIERRSQKRSLSNENATIIHEWFNISKIIIEKAIKTSKQRAKTKILLYTWKNYFVMKMFNIKIINSMKHSIKLKSNLRFVKNKFLKYTLKEREFANEIFSQMKETKIITWISND